ncbi:MAG: hypothetical protein AAF717_06775 [Bacteroidota bacterium]
MENTFSFDRVWNHIKRDVVLLRSTFLTALAICALLLFAFIQMNLFWDKKMSSEEFFGFLTFVYILSGILLSFSYFKEFHDDKYSALYLTLPISSSERLTAIWLSSFLGHSLTFLLLGVVVSSFFIFFGSFLFGAELNFVNISPGEYWKMAKTYLYLQPIFLFGAATFKKNRKSKTFLLVFSITLCFVFFNIALFAVLNRGLDMFDQTGLGAKTFELAQKDFSGFGKWLFMALLGPGILLATYFKLKEKAG